MRKLLSVDTNAKTVKGQKQGFITGILYLAPSDLSGRNVCANAKTAGCIDGCLNKAGLGGVYSSIQEARIRKTNWFFDDRQSFMIQIVKDIEALQRKAARLGLIPVVRLNGTSDIRWETVKFDYTLAHDKTRTVTIFELFPDVQFYDYTKLSNRKGIPANYDLTFSFSGREAYRIHNLKAFAQKMRVAVVFHSKDLPAEFFGKTVLNGDESDLRFLDPKDSIIGLYAKGPAKRDTGGFVIRLTVV